MMSVMSAAKMSVFARVTASPAGAPACSGAEGAPGAAGAHAETNSAITIHGTIHLRKVNSRFAFMISLLRVLATK
jgi:hypothetical protein